MLNIDKKVAIITGSNAGVGYALVDQLLEKDDNLEVCMLCRNSDLAEKAKKKLLMKHKNSLINIIIVDVAKVQSVIKAAEILKSKYHHIDYCFLNAGIMPNTQVNWFNLLRQVFSSNFLETMVTANGILYQKDETLSDGLKSIFATNLFGHFLLVRNLINNMGGKSLTQIIWTSSSNANKNAFNLNDIQHQNGHQAYSSSKFAVDLISYHLNTLFNQKNIYSHVTCPGLVISNLTYSIVPPLFWWLIFPILVLMRCILPSMTLTPENGAHALFWLTQEDPAKLSPSAKFYSRISLFGKQYIQTKQNQVNAEDAENLYLQLISMQKNYDII